MLRLGAGLTATVDPGRAAGEEEDDGAKEREDGRGQQRPRSGPVRGVGAGVGAVDGIADEGEANEVGDENHEGDLQERALAITVDMMWRRGRVLTRKASRAVMDAKKDPTTLAPTARRKAMKLRPQATGCRIMTCVRAFAVDAPARLRRKLRMPLSSKTPTAL